jgi:hypothetical protein
MAAGAKQVKKRIVKSKAVKRTNAVAAQAGTYINTGTDVKTFIEIDETDTSDEAALTLLDHIKATDDPAEVMALTDKLQRVIFHQQYKNAGA